MTREEERAYKKKWRENNREKARASGKKWRDNNKEKVRENNLRHNNKGKIDFYIVYSLMCGYVGKTNNPYKRMAHHTHKGKDVEGWFILNIVKTNKEALALEGEYHRMGHLGHTSTPFVFKDGAKTKVEKRRAYVKKYETSEKGRKKIAERRRNKRLEAMKKNKEKK